MMKIVVFDLDRPTEKWFLHACQNTSEI